MTPSNNNLTIDGIAELQGTASSSASPPLAELPAPSPAFTFGASFNKTAPIVELPGPVPSFIFGATYINMTRANSVALRAANKSTWWSLRMSE